jgi:hypothetical protein
MVRRARRCPHVDNVDVGLSTHVCACLFLEVRGRQEATENSQTNTLPPRRPGSPPRGEGKQRCEANSGQTTHARRVPCMPTARPQPCAEVCKSFAMQYRPLASRCFVGKCPFVQTAASTLQHIEPTARPPTKIPFLRVDRQLPDQPSLPTSPFRPSPELHGSGVDPEPRAKSSPPPLCP